MGKGIIGGTQGLQTQQHLLPRPQRRHGPGQRRGQRPTGGSTAVPEQASIEALEPHQLQGLHDQQRGCGDRHLTKGIALVNRLDPRRQHADLNRLALTGGGADPHGGAQPRSSQQQNNRQPFQQHA